MSLPESAPFRARGFTLLEILVSITLMGIISLTLAASLSVAFRARETGERIVQTSREAQIAFEAIRTDLQCAVPPNRGRFAGGFNGVQNFDQTGMETDDLTFYTTAPSPFHSDGGNGEFKRCELTAYMPDDGSITDHMLVHRMKNNLTSPEDLPQDTDEEILCRHVRGLIIQYFDGTDWQPSWDSSQNNNSLPVAIQVQLTLESPEKDATGQPKNVTFYRTFMMPCSAPPYQASTSSSGSSSSGTGSSSGSSAAGGGAK